MADEGVSSARRPIAFERVLLHLEDPVSGALLRVLIGAAIVPVWRAIAHGAEWTLAVFFTATLIAIRIVPLVVRRVVRFGDSLTGAWAERRQLAKRFDSYQWQKLFWIGCGLAAYGAASGQRFNTLVLLTVTSLTAGGLGLATWLYRTGGWRTGGRSPWSGTRRRLTARESRVQA